MGSNPRLSGTLHRGETPAHAFRCGCAQLTVPDKLANEAVDIPAGNACLNIAAQAVDFFG